MRFKINILTTILYLNYLGACNIVNYDYGGIVGMEEWGAKQNS